MAASWISIAITEVNEALSPEKKRQRTSSSSNKEKLEPTQLDFGDSNEHAANEKDAKSEVGTHSFFENAMNLSLRGFATAVEGELSKKADKTELGSRILEVKAEAAENEQKVGAAMLKLRGDMQQQVADVTLA